MTFVDYRDVAEVAARAFAGDDLVGGHLRARGRRHGHRTEIAAPMSRHAGRTVVALDLEPDQALGGLPSGPMRDGLSAMFADYTAYGFHGGNNLVLRTILGRAPRSLDNYFGEFSLKTATTRRHQETP